MAFDINALMQNPQFQMGLGLLGAAHPRNKPMLDAFTLIQTMQQRRAEEEERKQMMEYRRAQIEQARERARLYGGQVEEQRRENDLRTRAYEDARKIYEPYFSAASAAPATQAPSAQPAPQVAPTPALPQAAPRPPIPQMQLSGNRITNQAELDADRPAILTAELNNAKQRLAAGDPLASGDIDALTKEIERLPAPAKAISGSSEQQAAQATQVQTQTAAEKRRAVLEQAIQKSMALRAAGGMMNFEKPGEGLTGLSKSIMDAQKARNELARVEQEERKLPLEQQRADAATRQAAAAEARAATDAAAEQRLARTAGRELSEKKTGDWRNVAMASTNLDLLDSKIQELSKMPGFDRIFGVVGAVPDIPGSSASDARQLHKSITAQIAKETLQAIREGSKTGGALGNVSDKDIQLLETAIQNLDKAQSPDAARRAMGDVIKYTKKIRDISTEGYERIHNESPFPDLPKGTRFEKLVGGKRVFRLPNGKMVREE